MLLQILCFASFLFLQNCRNYFTVMSATVHKVKVVATKPFEGQKPGTSGLRKPVPTFQKAHYTENFIQSCLDGAFPNILNPTKTPPSPPPDSIALLVGGDGRLLTSETTQLICSIAAANGVFLLLLSYLHSELTRITTPN